ncbi:hypothetical protein JCM6882_003507 [Rhodosporidiobolus microsporus]
MNDAARQMHLLNLAALTAVVGQLPVAGEEGVDAVPPTGQHYTVRRATGENSAANPHLIVINDDVTDGDEARWPAADERVAGHKDQKTGRESWYEEQAGDAARYKHLKLTVGNLLANMMGLIDRDSREVWAIDNLPKDYLFAIHHTETASRMRRQDPYIFGSRAAPKFRTASEYTPHLHWLLTHQSNDGVACQCKYCAYAARAPIHALTQALPRVQLA